MNRFPRPPALATLVLIPCLATAAPLRAETLQYSLDLPPGQTIGLEVELAVHHPGELVVESDWSNHRVLSFRLEKPGQGSRPLRRTGPPPMRFDVPVTESEAGDGEPWKLSIRGIPARTWAKGSLKIVLPDAPAAAEAPVEPLVRAPVVEVKPWRRPIAVRGAPSEWRKLYAVSEDFRRLVTDGGRSDNFHWQDDLLRYLAAQRKRAETDALAQPTRNMLMRFVEAVGDVEALRTSDDPILAGPPPKKHRRAWEEIRRSQIMVLERNLDELMVDLQRARAPELAHEPWPVPFVTTLIACQRHFDERGRVPEPAWKYGEDADQQWEIVLAAAQVFAALAEVN